MILGWIKLHRKFLKWEWYDDLNTKSLFLHLLLTVNYEEKEWHGITIEIGQIVTSLSKLSEQTGLSIRNIRTSLNRLKTTHEITHKTTHHYTIITLNNYKSYQFDDCKSDTQNNTPSDKQVTHNRQASDKQVTTTKEYKNNKKEKNKEEKPISFLFDNYEFQQTWEKWMKYRQEIKKPLTPTTINQQLKDLEKHPVATAIQMINNSIKNSWQGLFELKTNGKTEERIIAIGGAPPKQMFDAEELYNRGEK